MPQDFERIIVPRRFAQLGILVLDGSGSMSWKLNEETTKAEAVNSAVKALISELTNSSARNNFSLAVLKFDTCTKIVLAPSRIYDDEGYTIDLNQSFNPTLNMGSWTHLDQAMEKAYEIANQHIYDSEITELPASVVIVVLSDGASQTDPIPTANKIKENERIKICSAFFSTNKYNEKQKQRGVDTLKEIASSPSDFSNVHDGEALRKFFIASIQSRVI